MSSGNSSTSTASAAAAASSAASSADAALRTLSGSGGGGGCQPSSSSPSSSNGDEYFTVGSMVLVVTCSNKSLKGEVIAFDQKTKILILKMPSSNGRSMLNDVHMVNLNMVSKVDVLQENKDPPGNLSHLNTVKLENRIRDQIERKKRAIMAYKEGVSEEGISLFKFISKTLDDICWKNNDILVMNAVTISPPYKPENVKGQTDNRAYKHVKKIVEKHANDEAVAAAAMNSSTNSIASPSSSSGHQSSNNSNTSSKEATPISSSSSGVGGGGGSSNRSNGSRRTTGGGNNNRSSNAISSSSRNNREPKPIFPWAHMRQF